MSEVREPYYTEGQPDPEDTRQSSTYRLGLYTFTWNTNNQLVLSQDPRAYQIQVTRQDHKDLLRFLSGRQPDLFARHVAELAKENPHLQAALGREYVFSFPPPAPETQDE